MTFETGQYLPRSDLRRCTSVSVAGVVRLIVSRISGNGTATSSSSMTPRRSKLASAASDSAVTSTWFFSATRLRMTFVQPSSDAIIVSIGVGPRSDPPRAAGSSITISCLPARALVRAWVGHSALTAIGTKVFWVIAIVRFSRTALPCQGRLGLGRGKLRRMQPIRDGAIGADAIGHHIGEQQLGEIDRDPAQHRIALVDQIENRPDNKGDDKRAPRHST